MAMTAALLDELAEHSELFGRLDAAGRARLAQTATEVTFAADEVVVREGEEAGAFYAILSGVLTVVAADFAGEDKHVAVLEAGSVVGEIAAISGEPRNATVRADTEVRALRFDMVGAFAVLKDYPTVLDELRRLCVDRSEELLSSVID